MMYTHVTLYNWENKSVPAALVSSYPISATSNPSRRCRRKSLSPRLPLPRFTVSNQIRCQTMAHFRVSSTSTRSIDPISRGLSLRRQSQICSIRIWVSSTATMLSQPEFCDGTMRSLRSRRSVNNFWARSGCIPMTASQRSFLANDLFRLRHLMFTASCSIAGITFLDNMKMTRPSPRHS
ncbi:hypothetical protein AKJ16_DCAP11673 [Drosera capensis]